MQNGQRTKTLTDQIVVRVTSELREWLETCSEEEGRTVAQSVRLFLKLAMERGPYR